MIDGRALTEADVERSLLGPVGLTWRRSTFTRRDVIQHLAEKLPVELATDAAAVEAVADRLLASWEVVPLVGAGQGIPRDRARSLRHVDLAGSGCWFLPPALRE